MRSAWLPCIVVLVAVLLPSPGRGQERFRASSILTEAVRVGEAFSDSVEFERIVDARLGHGLLWVLEPREVRAFDEAGRPRLRFGGSGEGPGDLFVPTRLRVDSLVHVFDARLARVTRFSPDGEPVGTSQAPPFVAAGQVVPIGEDRTLVVTSARFSFGGPASDPYQHVVLVGGGAADTLASLRVGGAIWHRRGERSPWGVADTGAGRLGAWDLSGDSLLALVDGRTGDVRWLCLDGEPRPCGEARTGGDASPFTGSDADRVLAELSERRGVPERDLELTEIPAWRSVAREAVFSDDGDQLWIMGDGGPRGGGTWTVLSREEGVKARVEFERPTWIRAVSGDGMLAVTHGGFDEAILILYRWRNGRPPF